MGTAASSWSGGRLTPEDIRKIERKNPAKHPEKATPSLVACHECADGVLRPLGGFGLCKRHYVAWRKANRKGDCACCDAKGVGLALVNPPTCAACYRRQRRAGMTEQMLEAKRALDREDQRRRRLANPGGSTARDRRVKEEEPERYEQRLAKRRDRHNAMLATETPEHREARAARYRANHLIRKARRAGQIKGEGEKHRSHLDRPVLPQKTRVVGLSRYLRYVEPEPEVTTTKLPEQTGLFDNALATLRVERRPEKKYRRRHAA